MIINGPVKTAIKMRLRFDTLLTFRLTDHVYKSQTVWYIAFLESILWFNTVWYHRVSYIITFNTGFSLVLT